MYSSKQIVNDFVSHQKGSIAITFALTFLAAAGLSGAAVDFGMAVRAKQRLQMAVDQGAIAGARLPATSNVNRISQAQAIFSSNLIGSEMAGVAPVINASNANVKVQASFRVPTTLLRLFRIETLGIRAETTARSQIHNGGVACLIALNPTTEDGLHLQGINKLSSENCWAWVNSTNAQAINAVGASQGRAQGFCTVGGVLGAQHFAPAPYTGCDPIEDPFASLEIPAGGGCQHNNKQLSRGNHSLTPGVYCGGIDIKPQADVTFAPGVYFIRDGKFQVQAGSTARGDGVVFIFQGPNAELIVRGGGNLDVRAPITSATNVSGLNGLVFVQDKQSTEAGRTTVIQGGGSVKIEGVVYLPTWRLDIGGNGDINQHSRYFTVVADSFYMEGNGRLYVRSDAEDAGLPDLMPKIKNGPVLLN